MMRSRFAWILVMVCCALTARTAEPLRIPLVLREIGGFDRSEEPVTGGVAFPQGAIKDVSTLRVLNPKGEEIPAQFAVMNRWWRDGSVRWVLVDFQASVLHGREVVYTLASDGKGTTTENPLKIDATADKVTIDTGVMKFTVQRPEFNLVDELWLDVDGERRYDADHQLVKSSRGNGIYLHSTFPQEPTALRYSPNYWTNNTLEVEESGPMRVCVKVTGKHALKKDPSRTMLDYVCRIHAYAGKSILKVQYVIESKEGKSIGNWLPIHRLGVRLAGDLGEEQKYRFGDEGPGLTGDLRPQSGPHRGWAAKDRAFLFASESDHVWGGGCLQGYTAYCKSVRPRNLGWVNVAGSKGGIMGGIRWFWQTWPKCVDASLNGVDLHLVPNLEHRVALYPQHKLGQAVNFFPGMSKTHDLIFYFHPAKWKNMSKVWGMLASPLRPLARADWLCERSQGLGRLASADRRMYPDENWPAIREFDQKFDQTVREFERHKERVRNTDAYGMFNFGDTLNYMTVHRRWMLGDRVGGTQRTWCNNYYDWPHALILQACRLDRRDWLEIAFQHCVHLQDIDMMCWHPNADMIGCNRYCDGTDHIRQQGGVYASNTYNHYKNQSLYERYWLTGDRRSLDMALLSSGFALRRGTRSLSQARSYGHGMQGLNYAYIQTGDKKYLVQSRNLMKRGKRGVMKGFSNGLWQGGIALEGFVTYYELTGDKEARDAVLARVAKLTQKGQYSGSALSSIAWGYGQTGDPNTRLLLLKAMARMGMHKRAGSGGNSLRNAGFLFWYLTGDLPKKIEVPPLEL